MVSLEHLIFLDLQNQQDFRNGCLVTLLIAREDGSMSVAARGSSHSAEALPQADVRANKYKQLGEPFDKLIGNIELQGYQARGRL